MGALIMSHGDDNGLVLPPELAPHQVVIIPIYKTNEEHKLVEKVCKSIKENLIKSGIRVCFDNRDTLKPGFKFNEYELKGVPLRIAIGPRDIKNKIVEIARRDTMTKCSIKQSDVVKYISSELKVIQDDLFKNAQNFQKQNTVEVDNFEEFKKVIYNTGGFVYAHWDGTTQTEKIIKEKTKATIRCIPIISNDKSGFCVYSGKLSPRKVLFAKAY